MERKMFGHRMKNRKPEDTKIPGKPPIDLDSEFGESSMSDSSMRFKKPKQEKASTKYMNPGYTRHEIDIPGDEPGMRSHMRKNEMDSMEKNYHMDVPDQTEDTLPKKIKRAHMLMDAPNQQDPKPLRGNIVHNVGYDGEEDTSGDEEYGPNDMQEDGMPKEHRKKMIASIVKRKMKKGMKDSY